MDANNTSRAAVQRVLVVIPAYNEAATVAQVVGQVQSLGLDVLVVDDGSTDATAALARKLGAHVASLSFNLGVGGAMRTGFKFALTRGYDAVVQVDADGQHDPTLVPLLLEGLADADVVIGNRFSGDGYVMAAHRRWAIRALARLSSSVTSSPLSDSTSGFRAHSRRAISVYAQHYPCEYLGDTVESLVIARKAGLRVAEVGVAMQHRTGGRPSQGTISSMRWVTRVVAATIVGMSRTLPVEDAT